MADKNIEQNVKTKPRFNIIDMLVILVVIACIVGVMLRYGVVDRIAMDTDKNTVKITFLVESVWPYLPMAFESGDDIYMTALNIKVGKLVEKSTASALGYYNLQDGTVARSYNEKRVDMTGVIEAKGIMTEEGFMLNGTTYVAAGTGFLMDNKDAQIYATILSVEQVS